jgi:NitT/TauT family transport system substrate-binding protein
VHRKNFVTAVAATGTLALAAPAVLRAQSAALRVSTGISDTYAEPIYAQEAGFFTKAGLSVAVTPQTNPTLSLTGVIAGAYDIGMTNTIAVAAAVLHGIPLVIIGGGALYRSDAATTVLACAIDAPLHRAKDLEGKTIATSGLQDLNTVGAEAWLAENGADTGKVRFIELGFAQMTAALERGTVDAATLNEPFLTAAQSEIRTFAKMFDAIARRFLNGVYVATPAFVRANPALVRRFLAANYATAAWANAHHPETATILSRSTRVDLETITRMTRVYYAESFEPQLIQPSLDAATRFKVLPRRVDLAELLGNGTGPPG